MQRSDSPFSPMLSLRVTPPTPEDLSPPKPARKLVFLDVSNKIHRDAHKEEAKPTILQPNLTNMKKSSTSKTSKFVPSNLLDRPSLHAQVKSFQQGLRSFEPVRKPAPQLSNIQAKERQRVSDKENNRLPRPFANEQVRQTTQVGQSSPTPSRLTPDGRLWRPVQLPSPKIYYSPLENYSA